MSNCVPSIFFLFGYCSNFLLCFFSRVMNYHHLHSLMHSVMLGIAGTAFMLPLVGKNCWFHLNYANENEILPNHTISPCICSTRRTHLKMFKVNSSNRKTSVTCSYKPSFPYRFFCLCLWQSCSLMLTSIASLMPVMFGFFHGSVAK